jgi:hypothetical protein
LQEVRKFHPQQVYLGYKLMKGTLVLSTCVVRLSQHLKNSPLYNNHVYLLVSLFNPWQRQLNTSISLVKHKGNFHL